MTLYEELYKIVKGKKVKFWNFAGNTYEFTHFYGSHHYQVKLAYVGKYYDEYLTTTHIVRLSTSSRSKRRFLRMEKTGLKLQNNLFIACISLTSYDTIILQFNYRSINYE